MLLAVLTGIVAGIVHVFTGPDHLAAVAPLSGSGGRRAWRVGWAWGFGHTAGVWVIAGIALVAKQAIDIDVLSKNAERFVGVVLVLVGVWTLRKALRHRVHVHEHTHDGRRHTHFHVHKRVRKPHPSKHEHNHVPTGIGLLHGIAGTGHLIAVLPALAMPGTATALAYLIGYSAGSITAMVGFAWVVGELIRRWVERFSLAYGFVLGALAITSIAVGVVWLGR